MAKPIVGLCGGIGAGKSVVADLLEQLGCCVISSDRLNHEVLQEPLVLEQLVSWWGPSVRRADGRPDRRRIGEIVFQAPEEKRRLESLVYPLIAERRTAIISDVESHPAIRAIVLDSPLLFENNLDRLCDFIIFVDADRTSRLARVVAARGWDESELARRESWQYSLEQKRAHADFVVDNRGSLDELRPQVDSILETILAGAGA